CLSRAGDAVFAVSIFAPSIDPHEAVAREMLRVRAATTAADGVRSTATYTEVPKLGIKLARLTVHCMAKGDRFWGRFWGSITGLIFPTEGRAMEATVS